MALIFSRASLLRIDYGLGRIAQLAVAPFQLNHIVVRRCWRRIQTLLQKLAHLPNLLVLG